MTQKEGTKLILRGALGPDQGSWTARVGGQEAGVKLTPGENSEEVVAWELPLADVHLPGPLTLQFTCVRLVQKENERGRKRGHLVLDAWSVR